MRYNLYCVWIAQVLKPPWVIIFACLVINFGHMHFKESRGLVEKLNQAFAPALSTRKSIPVSSSLWLWEFLCTSLVPESPCFLRPSSRWAVGSMLRPLLSPLGFGCMWKFSSLFFTPSGTWDCSGTGGVFNSLYPNTAVFLLFLLTYNLLLDLPIPR